MKLWGFVGRYDDEGFALDLDPRTVNLTEWHRRLTELEVRRQPREPARARALSTRCTAVQSRTWIDRQTRVVIVNLNIVDGTVGIVAAPKVVRLVGGLHHWAPQPHPPCGHCAVLRVLSVRPDSGSVENRVLQSLRVRHSRREARGLRRGRPRPLHALLHVHHLAIRASVPSPQSSGADRFVPPSPQVGIEVQDRRPRTLREQVQASLSALFSNVWITLDFIAAIVRAA